MNYVSVEPSTYNCTTHYIAAHFSDIKFNIFFQQLQLDEKHKKYCQSLTLCTKITVLTPTFKQVRCRCNQYAAKRSLFVKKQRRRTPVYILMVYLPYHPIPSPGQLFRKGTVFPAALFSLDGDKKICYHSVPAGMGSEPSAAGGEYSEASEWPRSVTILNLIICRCGGIGRHQGLKIP